MPPYRVVQTEFGVWRSPSTVFRLLYEGRNHVVWLDDAVETGFSIIGDDTGPHSFALGASLGAGSSARDGAEAAALLDALRSSITQLGDCEGLSGAVDGPFALGWLGWLGYEVGAAMVGTPKHATRGVDAGLIFVDRALVFDHSRRVIRALTLVDEADVVNPLLWLDRVRAALSSEPDPEPEPDPVPAPANANANATRNRETPARDASVVRSVGRWEVERDAYVREIETLKSHIAAGDCYQVCLTNRLRAPLTATPLELYLRLRSESPTSTSAFICFDGTSILSASPELFLTLSNDGVLTTRPMKGTRPRDPSLAVSIDDETRAELRADPKEQAENLMIVDLLRNDFSKVAEPTSIDTAELFTVETYAQVHQLVSEVRGTLDAERDAFDALAATFPGGSMTGAPKRRAMELIDELEGSPRGPYSGAVGFVSLDGAMELSMLIRCAVVENDTVTIGAGGGITIDSDPDREWDEVATKARSVAESIGIEMPAV